MYDDHRVRSNEASINEKLFAITRMVRVFISIAVALLAQLALAEQCDKRRSVVGQRVAGRG